MATKVSQKYSNGHAVSTTKKNGSIVKVTVWTPGVPNSTQRVTVKAL
jgi:hypothetical protein